MMFGYKSLAFLTILSMPCMYSCGGNDPVVNTVPEPAPNPDPVEPDVSTPADNTFTLGADISWLTEMENAGRKFHPDAKLSTAVEGTQLMKNKGIDAIRLRVFVDPANSMSGYAAVSVNKDGKAYCGKEDVVVKAMRAQDLGLNIMIDFHYSDSWADPGNQVIPEAWKDYSYDQLRDAIKFHTKDVLSALKEANVTNVKWVQVGNETHPGMLRTVYGGKTAAIQGGDYELYPEHYAGFVTTGYDAVKEIYPSAIVIVHHDKSNNWDLVKKNLEALKKYSAKYDMVGLSFYPCEVGSNDLIVEKNTQDNITAAFSTLNNIYNTYGKDVMFVELGMKMWPDENIATSSKYITDIMKMARKADHCRGVFYWEPFAWWWNNYNMGAFNVGDNEGKQLYPNTIFDSFVSK